ncbi:hypothetical protein [Azospirillum picis]|uniref:Uncharacterized protein n=1 Tax=Azospirillum picis TaxID=488438 RepID=A0ABU0MRW7_9PROT|nr:hypothetical protein [Azospirillum picis]MBP2302551.1 hypothetical protein [Azospirillum picis]MDQ0536207.1 hypothetical protein [Azospirillum picis]
MTSLNTRIPVEWAQQRIEIERLNRRVIELLEANNREVERRRSAETRLREIQATEGWLTGAFSAIRAAASKALSNQPLVEPHEKAAGEVLVAVGLARSRARSEAQSGRYIDPEKVLGPAFDAEPLVFGYTNWRGEYAIRRAIPKFVYFGASDYHPERQWLMFGIDCDKGAYRDFAVKDMIPLRALEQAASAPSCPTAEVSHG